MKEKLDTLLKEAVISLSLSIILFMLMIINWKFGSFVLLFQVYHVFVLKDSSLHDDETRMYIRLTGTMVSIIIFIIMLW